MAILNAGLATLTVGYILGVWTACAIFRKWQSLDGYHTSTRRSTRSAQPTPAVIWISQPRR